MDLFEHSVDHDPKLVPLAERMRPRHLSEVVGHDELLASDSVLSRALKKKHLPSMVLWGPPGCGKTTLASLLAAEIDARFVPLSAVTSNLAELRKVLEEARQRRVHRSLQTVLFIDEIHRFNKSQQDALLPHVEKGHAILIGATTENPSFAVNRALLSRARMFRLKELTIDDVVRILRTALDDAARGLGALNLQVADESLDAIARYAAGDARSALNLLDLATQTLPEGQLSLSLDEIRRAAVQANLGHDKAGDAHYDVVSAFIKSMRGSDPDASLYWMMRMLEAGEDPAFVLRRMIIFASEDIGTADPQALLIAVAADHAFHRLGMPEAYHTLGHACVYLARAPKSNACYKAWSAAQADVREHGALPVPLKLRNAVTGLMKAEGYGEGYRYPHNEGGFAEGETYLPDKLAGKRYYKPL